MIEAKLHTVFVSESLQIFGMSQKYFLYDFGIQFLTNNMFLKR